MNNIYINASAKSSEMLDKEFNNHYNYKLGDGLFLPKGSTVQIQNSFINSQGITGQSISIDEDINERILIGYYLQDTTFEVPRSEATDLKDNIYNFPGNQFLPQIPELYAHINYQANLEYLWTGAVINEPAFDTDGQGNIEQFAGYTEQPLPVCCAWNDEGTRRLQPLTSYIDIQIKKGIYSVSKLTEILTEQINNRTIPTIDNKSILEVKKDKNTFFGTLDNNGTTRRTVVRSYEEVQRQRQGAEFPSSTLKPKAALTVNDDFSDDIVGIVPINFSTLLEGFKNKDYNPPPNDSMNSDNFEWANYQNNEYIKRIAVEDSTDSSIVNQAYALFRHGAYIGSTDVTFDYDTEKSGFSIGGLSQIRRLPTNNQWGVDNSSSSQSIVYVKRTTDGDGFSEPIYWNGGNNGNAPEVTRAIFNTLNNIMSRVGGIYVLNWACNFSRDNSTINLEDKNVDFLNFEDYFTSKNEAIEKWNQTWIARLGFEYNDLNEKEEFKFYNQEETQIMPGFTQNTTIDNSSITTISTQYNDINYGGETTKDNALQAYDIPAVKTLQTFNMFDVAVSAYPINNNVNIKFPTAEGDLNAITVMQYSNSFYPFAQMFPVITKTASTTASGLPVLNENPYYIISSDIASKSDIFNGVKNIPLLGVIPISSLSNEDFIFSSFSDIIVPITNDRFINSLSIQILNSDLTIPRLGKNTSVILKISLPDEPLTLEPPVPPQEMKKEEKAAKSAKKA